MRPPRRTGDSFIASGVVQNDKYINIGITSYIFNENTIWFSHFKRYSFISYLLFIIYLFIIYYIFYIIYLLAQRLSQHLLQHLPHSFQQRHYWKSQLCACLRLTRRRSSALGSLRMPLRMNAFANE